MKFIFLLCFLCTSVIFSQKYVISKPHLDNENEIRIGCSIYNDNSTTEVSYEIQTSDHFSLGLSGSFSLFSNDSYFYDNRIDAVLNSKTNIYEAKIGIIIIKSTNFNENYRRKLDLNISSYISNENYNSSSVFINIPIFSVINKSEIFIED